MNTYNCSSTAAAAVLDPKFMPTGNNDFYHGSNAYLSGVAAPIPQQASSVPSSSNTLEPVVDMGHYHRQQHFHQQQQQSEHLVQQQHQDPYGVMHPNAGYQIQNACAYSNDDYGTVADLPMATRRKRNYNLEISQQQQTYEPECQTSSRNRLIHKRLENNIPGPNSSTIVHESDPVPSPKFGNNNVVSKSSSNRRRAKDISDDDDDGDDGDDPNNKKRFYDDDAEDKGHSTGDTVSEPGSSGNLLPEYAWMKRVHSSSGKDFVTQKLTH